MLGLRWVPADLALALSHDVDTPVVGNAVQPRRQPRIIRVEITRSLPKHHHDILCDVLRERVVHRLAPGLVLGRRPREQVLSDRDDGARAPGQG